MPDDFLFDRNEKCAKKGEERLSKGVVGAVVLAGGQGTRLGITGPKGTFPLSSIKRKSLFEMLSEKVQSARKKYSYDLPFAVMTSINNDKETKRFFETHPNCVAPFFFSQSELPLLDDEYHPTHISAADGNGSFFWSFKTSGLLDLWKNQGIEYVTVFVIDNPLLKPFDEDLIGITEEVSLLAVEKSYPEEKVGLIVQKKVIEYSEASEEIRRTHTLANISSFCFSLSFIERIASMSKEAFPKHMAQKMQKDIGKALWKQEYFIFDMFEKANSVHILKTARETSFAPLKNKEGLDSPKTCLEAIMLNERSLFEKVSTLPAPKNRLIELSSDFYYPTKELCAKWHKKPLPEDGYAS